MTLLFPGVLIKYCLSSNGQIGPCPEGEPGTGNKTGSNGYSPSSGCREVGTELLALLCATQERDFYAGRFSVAGEASFREALCCWGAQMHGGIWQLNVF